MHALAMSPGRPSASRRTDPPPPAPGFAHTLNAAPPSSETRNPPRSGCSTAKAAFAVLSLAFLSAFAPTLPSARAAEPLTLPLRLPSRDGRLVGAVDRTVDGELVWSLERTGRVVVAASPLGITLDGIPLGRNAVPGSPVSRDIDQTYPWRGGKRTAIDRSREYRIPIRETGDPSGSWQLEVRVFEDGFAFRYRIPGNGVRKVQGESSAWTLREGTLVWHQTNTRDYEGPYQRKAVEAIPVPLSTDARATPVHLGPPVTAELPEGGFLLLTEANLRRYSGMTLKPTGSPRLRAAFQDDPEGFAVEGEVLTPWRVTVVANDLDALVNSDVVPNLADAPDPQRFPAGARTDWIRPGRALITWCVFGNDGAQWPLQKWFVDRCAALHCEYLLVDAGWRSERWGWLRDGGDVWARLKEICDYGASRGVGIVVWHAYPEGRDDGPGLTRPEARQEFFRRCAAAGVKGVKIDFFDSERREIVDVYEELARLAADHRIAINFHGAHKPTGEVRTWPNEITREGIREQEYVLWDSLPLEHYAALPFTRMAVGHSDFLPTYVRPRFLRNTTATFQAATAILATSSFISWPDHPDDYLASPLLGLIQAMPTVWDETRVLHGSVLGECVAFARRAGDDWFVGVINGTDRVRPWSFDAGCLPPGDYLATLYRDSAPHRTVVSLETGRELRSSGRVADPAAPSSRLHVELAGGGGFVAWIRPRPKFP